MSKSEDPDAELREWLDSTRQPEPVEPLAAFNPCNGEPAEQDYQDWGEPAWTLVERDGDEGDLMSRWITVARSDCLDLEECV